MNLEKIPLRDTHLDQDFKIDLASFENHDIIDLKNLHVKGDLKINAADILEINLIVKGSMILKDSITLELIEYPFTSEIEEEFCLNDPYFQETYQKEQNTLDILEILWENIVLEVPIRLTEKLDPVLKGEGWSLGVDNNNDQIDPRLAKLNELLGKREE